MLLACQTKYIMLNNKGEGAIRNIYHGGDLRISMAPDISVKETEESREQKALNEKKLRTYNEIMDSNRRREMNNEALRNEEDQKRLKRRNENIVDEDYDLQERAQIANRRKLFNSINSHEYERSQSRAGNNIDETGAPRDERVYYSENVSSINQFNLFDMMLGHDKRDWRVTQEDYLRDMKMEQEETDLEELNKKRKT